MKKTFYNSETKNSERGRKRERKRKKETIFGRERKRERENVHSLSESNVEYITANVEKSERQRESGDRAIEDKICLTFKT